MFVLAEGLNSRYISFPHQKKRKTFLLVLLFNKISITFTFTIFC